MKAHLSHKIKSPLVMVVVSILLIIFSLSTSTADLTDDLVGYWPLDEDASDAINNNDGKLVGGAKFVKDGTRGQVLSVDGADGRVEIPDAEELNFEPADSFSVALWLDIQKLPGHWAGVVTKGRDTPNWYGLWVMPESKWHFVGGQGGVNVRLDTGLAETGWLHVVCVYDASAHTQTVYVDAEAVGEGKGVTIAASGAADLWFGGAKSVNEFLEARMDDVLLYRRILNEDELKELASGVDVLAIKPQGKLATTWAQLKR